MLAELDSLKAAALAAIAAAADEAAVESARVEYLGKKSVLAGMGGRMREVPPEQKGAVGAKLNDVRTAVTAAIEEKKEALVAARDAAAVAGIDVTLPGRPAWRGALHPLTQLQHRAVRILRGDLEGARRLLDSAEVAARRADTSRLALSSRVELLLAEDRLEEALAAADDIAERWGAIVNPWWAPWRSLKARALDGLGHTDAALELASQGINTLYTKPLAFLQNAIDWSLEEPDLLALRGRTQLASTLVPLREGDQRLWELVNYALALAGLAGVWVWRRRVGAADRRRYARVLAEV